MKIRVPEKTTLEEGLYSARLESVEKVSNDRGSYLRWTFAVDCDGEIIRRVANSSMSLGPKSKATGWLQAVMGRPLEAGEDIDFDELLPLNCRIVVKPTDEGFDKIEDVLGSRKPRRVDACGRTASREPDIEDGDLPF